MKIYSLLITLALVVTADLLSAQQKADFVEVEWSKEIDAARRATLDQIIGMDDDYYYTITSNIKMMGKSKYELQKFDKRMKLVKEAEISMEYQRRALFLVDILIINGRIWVYDMYFNRSDKKSYVFVREIDPKTLRVKGQRKKVASLIGRGAVVGGTSTRDNSVSVVTSKDEQYIGIQMNSPIPKQEQERSTIYVFDASMEELWKQEIKLPWRDRLFIMEEFDIANDGTVYLLGKRYIDKKKPKRNGDPNYDYRILQMQNGGGELNDFKVDLGDRFITDMTLAVSENNVLACAGFYSEKGIKSISGTCFLSIDGANGDIIKSNTKAFDIEMLVEDVSERKEEKIRKKAEKGKDVELAKFKLDEIQVLEDGSAYVVGEQFYEWVDHRMGTGANGSSRTRTYWHFYFNTIIVIKLSPEGIIEWAHKIPKRQHTINDNGIYSSYAMAIVGKDVYFVFNDNARNLEPGATKTMNVDFRKKNNVVAIVRVDKNGEITKDYLFGRDETEVLFRPVVSNQIGENQMLLFGEFKSTHRFAILKIEP